MSSATARHNIALPAPGAKPVGGLADRRFHYTPSFDTDIRRTFRRLRREQRTTQQLPLGLEAAS